MNKQIDKKLNHNGFFKEGDCIEISGQLVGIVTRANDQIFWISRFKQSSGFGLFRSTDESAYSNEAGHYHGKYWIRKVAAPKEYKLLDVSVLT